MYKRQQSASSIRRQGTSFSSRSTKAVGNLKWVSRSFLVKSFLGGQPVVEDILRCGIDGDEEGGDAVLLLLGAIELP